MSKKTIGIVGLILGIIILVVSLGADVFGLGNAMGFGWKQILGAVLGVILALVGGWMAWYRSTKNG